MAHYKGVHEDAHKMVAGVHTLSSDGVNLLKCALQHLPHSMLTTINLTQVVCSISEESLS